MKEFSFWLINLFCSERIAEDIMGDLEEQYETNLERLTKSQASWLLLRDTLSFIFSYALQKRKRDHSFHVFSTTQNSIPMLKNYIKVAWRGLVRHRLFSVINIVGLSAGMSIGLLFIVWISFIKTYEDFHEHKDNIYRVISRTDDKVEDRLLASTPAPLGQQLADDHTGFGEIVRINNTLRAEAEVGVMKIPLSGLFVDPSFMHVFSFQMLTGDPSLSDPYGILITEPLANKLFNNQDAVGKVLSLGALGDFTIKGIMKKPPKNSHIYFEALLPYQTMERLANQGKLDIKRHDWKEYYNNYTYMLLPDGAKIDELNTTLAGIAQGQYKNMHQFDASFKLQHISEIALGTDTKNEVGTSWGMELYLIGMVFTLLILLPACFNYANIATARAMSRAKEIGLRKVVGGGKKQVFLQFILETIIVSLISLIGAYIIFLLIRGEFLAMIVRGATSLNFDITPVTIIYSILFAILTGLIAGIFPALHFAGIQPISALKSATKTKLMGNINVQKTLLVIQFALSFGFIMGVVVFFDQYIKTFDYDLGFEQENILDIPLQDVEAELLRTRMDQLASVQKVSMSSHILGLNSNHKTWLKNEKLKDSVEVTHMSVDHNYLHNMGIELVAGRDFQQASSRDINSIIVNEEFLTLYDLEDPRAAIGEFIMVNDSTSFRIHGIVKNFHFENLSKKIEPLMLNSDPSQYQYANVKIGSADIPTTLSNMGMEWKTLSHYKFESKFFSDEVEESFDIYTNIVKIFFFLGFLAITISCLGLLGMVVFSTQARIKEVGIRKVLGAEVSSITYLLTKSYMKLMVIGALISLPISYMLFNVILANHNVYATDIGPLPVIISLVLLLGLGAATVFSQTWRAANSNPVDTLRYE